MKGNSNLWNLTPSLGKMDFFTQEELDRIPAYAGQEPAEEQHAQLKVSYDKLDHLCWKLYENGYAFDIRKDPRKMNGRGNFVFQEYQWAKVYPQEYKADCAEVYAYIITLRDGTIIFHMMGIKEYMEHPVSINASRACRTEIDITNSSYDDLVKQFIDFDQKHRQLFMDTGAAFGIERFIKEKQLLEMNATVDLLKYKKQIILQGPPGTGKTRLAESIAEAVVSENKLSPDIIREVFHIGMEVSTVTEYSSFRIMSYSNTHVLIRLVSAGSEYNIPFSEIIGAYYKKMWLNAEIKNGHDTYTAAMGKYLHTIDIQGRYLKLIQFHPSYAYEDFVRGIRAKNADGRLVYETENMLLGQFASLAYENYLTHIKEPQVASKEAWLQDMFDLFTQHVDDVIYNGQRYAINDNVYIKEVEEDAFRYTGDVWATEHGHRMKFSDIKQLYLANVTSRPEIKSVSVSGLAKQHATYYFAILEHFREFLKKQPPFVALKEKTPLKNFVLIIDEINRANLSAVLGELIYALEYRGRALDGVYELNGSRKIILPPNLYIIGTMNTADRSVGNIDYAIRRRFAFVTVLPAADVIRQVLKDETVKNLATILFENVAALFTPDYLITDFKAEEVQLGHSYFLAETIAQLELKLKYEIKPILYEYVKDGVLNEMVRAKIEMLSV